MFDFLSGLNPWTPTNPTALAPGFEGPVLPDAAAAQLPGQMGSNPMNSLLSALGNVKAPPAPEVQRVGTPSGGPSAPMINAPTPRAPTPVRSDQFMQLLQMLGNGPAASVQSPLPPQPRLGQILGGR